MKSVFFTISLLVMSLSFSQIALAEPIPTADMDNFLIRLRSTLPDPSNPESRFNAFDRPAYTRLLREAQAYRDRLPHNSSARANMGDIARLLTDHLKIGDEVTEGGTKPLTRFGANQVIEHGHAVQQRLRGLSFRSGNIWRLIGGAAVAVAAGLTVAPDQAQADDLQLIEPEIDIEGFATEVAQ
jgi:hypothetical protein